MTAGAGTFGGFRPEGWNPKLSITLRGPSPAGAVLRWTVAAPNGEPWFEHIVPVREVGDGEYLTVDLQRWVDGVDIAQAGTVPFTLRLVSELDGVDELLHDGALTVLELEGERRYGVDEGWRLQYGTLALDVVAEPDAPPLRAAVFVQDDVDAFRMEAHCFHDGVRIGRSSAVDDRLAFTANDGAVLAHTVVLTFDTIRGWNNLAESGWGGEWHLLDAHDGHYAIKVVLDGAVIATMSFTVMGGRIEPVGPVEADPWWGAVILVGIANPGTTSAFYGDAISGADPLSIDDVYAARTERAPRADAPLDPNAEQALSAFFDRVERLLNTWEADLVAAPPPFDHGQVLAAEAVLRERAGYEELRDAVAGLSPDHPLSLNGEILTVEELCTRIETLFSAASSRISTAGEEQDDALAPFLAVLNGDKRAIFLDRPAHLFEYRTSGRRVISTPGELLAAEYWLFEGPYDVPATATIDGVTVTASTRGWKVVGWRFDADGTIVEEFDHQGPGTDAPLSIYRRDPAPDPSV